MLPRENRLTSIEDFRALRRSHVRLHTTAALVQCAETDGPTRVGFIVTKKNGNAVTRNLIKRRLREAAQPLLAAYPEGRSFVLVAKQGAEKVPVAATSAELLNVARKRLR